MARPFAAFDLDGTLIRWQLYHALADELARNGLLDVDKYRKVRAARMNWKNRTAQTSFHTYERAVVKLIDGAIADITVADFNTACQEVVNVYKDQVYTYTRHLIEQLKAENYILFALSASQIEIVKLVATYYGFDDYGGTEYEIKAGHFTGEKQVLKRDKKPALLRQLVNKHKATWKGSMAIGDSESDIPMLACVERPITFNPTSDLYAHAIEEKWKIVLERKNVIYELESVSGHYQLKSKPQLSYAMSYGLTSGAAHGKLMRHLLDKAGYVKSQDIKQADIIIAHSAGCWRLPPNISPKLVIFVGPALNKPTFTNWLRANSRNIITFVGEKHVVRGAKIIGINFIYGILQPSRNYTIIRTAKNASLQLFPGSQVLYVANHYDPWPRPANIQSYLNDKPWAFISLPGSHDNIWEIPELYIPIINYYAKQLLA